MIAQLICIEVHITIICKLLYANKFRVTSDYQQLIIVQSAINIIANLSELILNEVKVTVVVTVIQKSLQIQTLNRWYLKVGHPWWQLSKTEKVVITIIWTVFSNSTQDFLALFNLHRYIMIRRCVISTDKQEKSFQKAVESIVLHCDPDDGDEFRRRCLYSLANNYGRCWCFGAFLVPWRISGALAQFRCFDAYCGPCAI